MNNVLIDPRSRLPLWAILGAPLIGVPMLVALLALGAPDAADRRSEGADAGQAAEQAVEPASPAMNLTLALDDART